MSAMSKALGTILILAFLIASLSCQRLFGASDTQGVSTSSTPVTKLTLPQPWITPPAGSFIEQIEVRKGANSPDDEFFFGGLPYDYSLYAYDVDGKMPQIEYGQNKFAVNFSAGPRVRVATPEEWDSGSRITTIPRPVYPKGSDNTSGELE